MESVDPSRIPALLARVYIFQGFEPEKLIQIADLFEYCQAQAGEVILSPQDAEPGLYIVYEGKIRSTTPGRSGELLETELLPGEYFGEGTLLYATPKLPTVNAIEDSHFLVLRSEQYRALIEEYPGIEEVLRTVNKSRMLARSCGFKWLNKGEVVYFISRKHVIFLIFMLLLPLFFWVGSFPFLSFGIAEFASQSGMNFFLVIGVGLFLFCPLLALWFYIDWKNDYYLVTNQRVIWQEKIVMMYESRTEAPLDTVLATDVVTSLLGRYFDYGLVSARTYTGKVPFHRTSQPYLMASFIEGLRQRRMHFAQDDNVEEITLAVERALERHLNPSITDAIPVIAAPPAARPSKNNLKKAGLGEIFRNFLQVRFQQGNIITYRKHWPVLVGKIFLPATGIIIISVMLAFLYQADLSSDIFCLGGLIIVMGYIGLFSWLFYNLLDWRNDIYRLTPEQIFDIEKKPLGDEVKKSADLDNILSIEHRRIGMLGIILNFGNVIINVGTTEFVFIGVYNPDRVHQDIADYREALRRRNQEVERAREREKMIKWLVAYYETAGKQPNDATVKIDRQILKQNVRDLLNKD